MRKPTDAENAEAIKKAVLAFCIRKENARKTIKHKPNSIEDLAEKAMVRELETITRVVLATPSLKAATKAADADLKARMSPGSSLKAAIKTARDDAEAKLGAAQAEYKTACDSHRDTRRAILAPRQTNVAAKAEAWYAAQRAKQATRDPNKERDERIARDKILGEISQGPKGIAQRHAYFTTQQKNWESEKVPQLTMSSHDTEALRVADEQLELARATYALANAVYAITIEAIRKLTRPTFNNTQLIRLEEEETLKRAKRRGKQRRKSAFHQKTREQLALLKTRVESTEAFEKQMRLSPPTNTTKSLRLVAAEEQFVRQETWITELRNENRRLRRELAEAKKK